MIPGVLGSSCNCCFPGNFPLKNLGDVSFGEVTLTTAPFTFALLFLASGFA